MGYEGNRSGGTGSQAVPALGAAFFKQLRGKGQLANPLLIGMVAWDYGAVAGLNSVQQGKLLSDFRSEIPGSCQILTVWPAGGNRRIRTGKGMLTDKRSSGNRSESGFLGSILQLDQSVFKGSVAVGDNQHCRCVVAGDSC